MRSSVTISIFLTFIIIPAALSLSFDMSPITRSDGGRINLTGNAYITEDGIQVTTNERDKDRKWGVGRATYGELLHLWDSASHNLAHFSTNFSFVLDSSGNANFGDGFTFFLAPNGSSIQPSSSSGQPSSSSGSSLGLSIPPSPFVAVEFDTFANTELDDPQYNVSVLPLQPHVGIDLNSTRSVATAVWYNNISAGWLSDAWITYNSTTKLLRVDFTGKYGELIRPGNLSYEVDLREYLPEYVTVGFSAATGDYVQKNNVRSWRFSSTDVTDHSNKDPTPSPSLQPKLGKGTNNKNPLIFGLSGAAILVLASTFALCFFLRKNKKKKEEEEYQGVEEDQLSDSAMDDEFEKGNGPKRFSYNELVLATNDFAEKLGEGGFGSVYKGFLTATNTYIAVKKVSEGSKQGRKEYEAEVKVISQLRHINLVELIGWCHRRAELLLVYEFMPNGSLDSHLFKVNSILTWEIRYKIAQGLASALLYLHEGLRQYVVHRDIKSSNVMLDSNFNAKLGDFGLARLVDRDKDLHSTVPAGTIGYMAPEYLADWKASKETDIYSFGILLLEIACGRRPIDYRYLPNQIVLVEWVWSLYEVGHLLDAADSKVDSSEYEGHKIERLMVVGLWCIHPDSAQRPPIRQVMQVLESGDPLPDLPLAMPNPKAAYIKYASRVATAAGSRSNTNSSGGGAFGIHSGISGQGSISSNLTPSSAGSASDLLPN